jgi:Glycosyltransferase sugar-binding region containing DXD motif
MLSTFQSPMWVSNIKNGATGTTEIKPSTSKDTNNVHRESLRHPLRYLSPQAKGSLKHVDTPRQSHHIHNNHRIPNILLFTHSINLLTSSKVFGEDKALKKNVQNTIDLHQNAQVFFLTDVECISSIKRVMGSDSPLLSYFEQETQGMFKADICRGAALYERGGLYFDVDLQARMSLWEVIRPTSTFVVPFVHSDSKYPGNFFQAFIGSEPKNPIIKQYLQLFIEYYGGKIDLNGPLGVQLLRRAHDDVVGTTESPKVSSQVSQFFVEVLYSAKLFPDIPPPNWGERRACRFVVVANTKAPYLVPFYSRVKGSRMCGGKESEKK